MSLNERDWLRDFQRDVHEQKQRQQREVFGRLFGTGTSDTSGISDTCEPPASAPASASSLTLDDLVMLLGMDSAYACATLRRCVQEYGYGDDDQVAGTHKEVNRFRFLRHLYQQGVWQVASPV